MVTNDESTAIGNEGLGMNGNPNGYELVVMYSKLPRERIKYHPNADEEVINAISLGIIFLMAFWSGPAIQAFVKLTEAISLLDKDGTIELVVVDIDGADELSAVSDFLGGMRGCGETAWVRNGSIIATSGIGLNLQCFVPNTQLLLEVA